MGGNEGAIANSVLLDRSPLGRATSAAWSSNYGPITQSCHRRGRGGGSSDLFGRVGRFEPSNTGTIDNSLCNGLCEGHECGWSDW